MVSNTSVMRGASINLVELLDPVAQEAILNPMSLRLPESEVVQAKTRARFMAVSPKE